MSIVQKKAVGWSLVLAIVIAGAFFTLSRNGPDQVQKIQVAASVTARGIIDVDGGLVQIASDRDGVVREVLVVEGEQVTKGQPLALIDNRTARIQLKIATMQVAEKEAAVKEAGVGLRQAQRERDRLKPLVVAGVVSRKSFDEGEDALRQANAILESRQAALTTSLAQLDSAKHEVEVRIVRAPTDGTIVRRFVRPGDGVSTLNVTSMFSFAPNTGLIVRAELEEDSAVNLAKGQTAEILLESDQGRLFAMGKINRVAASFGPRRATSYETTDRSDIRVIEAIVAFDGAPPPTPLGQRVIVRFPLAAESP